MRAPRTLEPEDMDSCRLNWQRRYITRARHFLDSTAVLFVLYLLRHLRKVPAEVFCSWKPALLVSFMNFYTGNGAVRVILTVLSVLSGIWFVISFFLSAVRCNMPPGSPKFPRAVTFPLALPWLVLTAGVAVIIIHAIVT